MKPLASRSRNNNKPTLTHSKTVCLAKPSRSSYFELEKEKETVRDLNKALAMKFSQVAKLEEMLKEQNQINTALSEDILKLTLNLFD